VSITSVYNVDLYILSTAQMVIVSETYRYINKDANPSIASVQHYRRHWFHYICTSSVAIRWTKTPTYYSLIHWASKELGNYGV
jgi:hypothetical protein